MIRLSITIVIICFFFGRVYSQKSQLEKIRRSIGLVEMYRSWPPNYRGHRPEDKESVIRFFDYGGTNSYHENSYFDINVQFDQSSCILKIEGKKGNKNKVIKIETMEIDLSEFSNYGYFDDYEINTAFMVYDVPTKWKREQPISGIIKEYETKGFWIQTRGNKDGISSRAQTQIIQDAGNAIIELAKDFCN